MFELQRPKIYKDVHLHILNGKKGKHSPYIPTPKKEDKRIVGYTTNLQNSNTVTLLYVIDGYSIQ